MFNLTFCSKQLQISIIIYLILISIYYYFKPNISFNPNGSLKSFGTDNKNNTTIFPFWIVVFVLAILSYYIVIFFCLIKK